MASVDGHCFVTQQYFPPIFLKSRAFLYYLFFPFTECKVFTFRECKLSVVNEKAIT